MDLLKSAKCHRISVKDNERGIYPYAGQKKAGIFFCRPYYTLMCTFYCTTTGIIFFQFFPLSAR